MRIEQIAEVAHEANRIYCQTIGDFSQLRWIDAPDWQKTSAINGVKFHLANPEATPSASHEAWLKEKEEAGWSWGEVKDVEKKEHPCFLSYPELHEEQRVKDTLFMGIIQAMKVLL